MLGQKKNRGNPISQTRITPTRSTRFLRPIHAVCDMTIAFTPISPAYRWTVGVYQTLGASSGQAFVTTRSSSGALASC
jgi:hypothetical protein